MTAVIFPGEGSHYVGMGKSLYDGFSCARSVFDRIDEVLGWKLSAVCFEGPDKELKRTLTQELAIFAVSLAAYEIFKQKNIDIDFLAGLSSGECSCFYVSQTLEFSSLVNFVMLRAQMMEAGSKVNPSTMFAVMGLEREHLQLHSRTQGYHISNMNSPQQIVISLKKENKENVREFIEAQGAKAIELEVCGGFHSPFMEDAQARLETKAAGVKFADASIPIVSNVTACAHTQGEELKKNIIEQLSLPVRWEECVRFMVAQGVDIFFELGPSQVLRGLIRKIDHRVKVVSLGEKEDFDSFLASASHSQKGSVT